MDDKNVKPFTKEEIEVYLETEKAEESKEVKLQSLINNNPISKPVEQESAKEEKIPQPKQNENPHSTDVSNKIISTKPEKKEEPKPMTPPKKIESMQPKVIKNNTSKIYIGDRVRINPRCTKTVTGVTIPTFAYSNVYTVKKIYSNRIVIKINTLQYAVTINDLIKLK